SRPILRSQLSATIRSRHRPRRLRTRPIDRSHPRLDLRTRGRPPTKIRFGSILPSRRRLILLDRRWPLVLLAALGAHWLCRPVSSGGLGGALFGLLGGGRLA